MNHIDPMAIIVSVFFLAQAGEAPRNGVTAENPETLLLITSLYVFALAAFLGYQLISRVPPLLHTPLMSATNAISGISLIGSLVIAGSRHQGEHAMLASLLGCAAVTSAMINVTGGFLITDRMLKMFHKKEPVKALENKTGEKQ
ncbi:MAG TPA: NAD(P) transhydrogenase subunit alpha [Verrucomicrobiae bacterium]|jgi:NAD(P) transhydrogenase subunit alpha|nr:NAD(P) transhydrogenase subunit alpha [Verrucomicrobiae bacterium]